MSKEGRFIVVHSFGDFSSRQVNPFALDLRQHIVGMSGEKFAHLIAVVQEEEKGDGTHDHL